ncbi:cell division protein ZapA [Buchnera aphidicola]|uniref:cell division protein ZapA n=1 Tax=Buchnera aphidicola TaxID=9 RepID=UPI00094C3738|nr:cell division protein ZapA [Buchnera aphidicola]
MTIKTIDVEILGRIIKVNCPKNYSSELLSSVNNFNDRLQELKEKTGVSNIEKLVIIAALNICYELQLEKKNNLQYITKIEKKISILNVILNDIIE